MIIWFLYFLIMFLPVVYFFFNIKRFLNPCFFCIVFSLELFLALWLHFPSIFVFKLNYPLPHVVYRYLKETFPIWLFMVWLATKETERFQKPLEAVGKIFVPIGIACFCFLTFNCLTGVDFQTVTNIRWSYHGALTWNVMFLIAFYGWRKAQFSWFTSFVASTISVFVAGLIFEIFHLIGYVVYTVTAQPQTIRYRLFSPAYPLFIETEWVCVVLLVVMMYVLKVKPNRKWWVLLIFALTFSFFYSFNLSWYRVARFPAMLTFAYLPFSIKNVKEVNVKNEGRNNTVPS